MLSNEERNHIRAEEIFRAEIRESIAQQPRTTWKRFLKFLNTGVGLWLLSTVALGSITTIYSSWKTEDANSRQVRNRKGRLTIEIDYRISRFRESIEHMQANPTTTSRYITDTISNLETPDLSGQKPFRWAVFDEYKTQSLGALLIELASLSTGRERDRAIEQIHALEKLQTINSDFAHIPGGVLPDPKAFTLILDVVNSAFPKQPWFDPRLIPSGGRPN
jgi:hypothetical protein